MSIKIVDKNTPGPWQVINGSVYRQLYAWMVPGWPDVRRPLKFKV